MIGEEKKRCKITGMRMRSTYSKNCTMKIDNKTKGERGGVINESDMIVYLDVGCAVGTE